MVVKPESQRGKAGSSLEDQRPRSRHAKGMPPLYLLKRGFRESPVLRLLYIYIYIYI